MAEITELLGVARAGDPAALERVFEAVYPHLRKIATSRLSRDRMTLTPTELVSETFLRLIGAQQLDLEDRRHFFACAARAMRMIIIDNARRAAANKRGGQAMRVTWSEDLPSGLDDASTILDLDRALGHLKAVNARAHEVVNLRFFAGLTAPETAELLGLSLRTVNREWQKARSFLYAHIADGSLSDTSSQPSPPGGGTLDGR